MKSTRKTHPQHRANGFTIVELLVIIVVIVILATITIVSYRAVTQGSRLETAKTDAQTAAAAINKYKAENGAYPTNLSQVTMSGTQASFNYVLGGDGASYCIDATFEEAVANVIDSSASAREGACTTGGSGAPATVTNVATNPSAEVDLAGVSGYWSGVAARVEGGAVSGNTSFKVVTTSTTQPQGLIHYVGPTSPNRTYTCSMSFKGTEGAGVQLSGRVALAGGGNAEGLGNRSVTMSSSQWKRLTVRFTTPSNTGTGFSVQYRVLATAAGITIQSDALMCTEGSTAHLYADGDSRGWSWAGPRQSSASTGPSLGVEPTN